MKVKESKLLSLKGDYLKPALAKAEEAGGDPDAFRKHLRMLVDKAREEAKNGKA